MLQPLAAPAAARRLPRGAAWFPRASRAARLVVSANTQRSNSITKKRTSGPPGLPPINDNSGGGGGGGWDGHRIVRNLAINAALFGIYCLLDSGGPGGIFNGGGGGWGGGGECGLGGPGWLGVVWLALRCGGLACIAVQQTVPDAPLLASSATLQRSC